ncbi:MAG TPA: helix-turn-helix transcriptional regulator [Chthoniobacterales bacterium]|nr:helix-turn-helix transcriptional regulator [Chthoniobacterales bacterium]
MPPSAVRPATGSSKTESVSLLETALYPLTPRQGEVLQWVTAGKRDSEVAAILGLSPRTVNKHVQLILKKLHVETRTAAANWWHERQRMVERALSAERGSNGGRS